MGSSTILKRSISVSGHKTSISLEDEFWNCLREIAEQRGEKYVSKLIGDINAEREFGNLSSAIRMYILRHYRDQVVQQKDETPRLDLRIQSSTELGKGSA
jgi:predicted DNA-binding ribbon-helix-helix protein